MAGERSIERGIGVSYETWVLLIKGREACLFGVAPLSVPMNGARVAVSKDEGGCVWALTTDEVTYNPTHFIRACWLVMPALLDTYGELSNWIYAENRRAIRWGAKMGFEFDPPAPYGPHGKDFLRFRYTLDMYREKASGAGGLLC